MAAVCSRRLADRLSNMALPREDCSSRSRIDLSDRMILRESLIPRADLQCQRDAKMRCFRWRRSLRTLRKVRRDHRGRAKRVKVTRPSRFIGS